MVFHWGLSDSKSPQISRTLLSILAVFNNAVVWMVSTRLPISKSFRPFNNLLVTMPKAPITIVIIVIFMFHSFFNSLARSRYLLLLLLSPGSNTPTRHQLYGHLPPITKTIQVRRTRHAGHCWRSRDELIRDVLLWTPTHGRAKAGRPARTYIQQLCEDTECCPEDLPRAMNDREEWRERVRDIRATSATWWWWWFHSL